MVDVFAEGFEQSEAQLDFSHVANVGERKYLSDEVPDYGSLVSAKLNVPGPIKNNQYLSSVFEKGFTDFLKDFEVKKRIVWDIATGPQAFAIIGADAQMVKNAAIIFENHNPLGALFNIDVYIVHGDTLGVLNREDLKMRPRESVYKDAKTLEEKRKIVCKLINENIEF
ncbi:citrate lyase holo-[acyl-carrier protein] synthase [Companilactobacillus hulinensis]|uniref:citrate lyase holo-[acyl-carrier protein] synthase n=1 Tax=Companilactobacillus hulinensis TaxID=2486007 RepID=UPI000F7B1DED|nr:citrate lyase holo-[acyl-carrier protein] synthase [Companilactobacillus hulinensis]